MKPFCTLTDNQGTFTVNIIRGGNLNMFAEDRLHVLVNLLDHCNLRCDYCINARRTQTGKKERLDLSAFLHFAEIISRLGKKKVAFSFAGGEPLLMPGLENMIRNLVQLFPVEGLALAIASNLVSPLEKIVSVFTAAGEYKLNFIASVHFGQFDHHQYFNILMKLPKHLLQRIKFKLLLSPEHFDAIVACAEYLEQNSCRVGIGPLYDKDGLAKGYTARQIKIGALLVQRYPLSTEATLFSEFLDGSEMRTVHFNAQEALLHPELVAYKGLHCAAGVNSLRIGSTGGVRRCFGFQDEFNIKDIDDNILANFYHPVRCPQERCRCAPLLDVSKWTEASMAPQHITLLQERLASEP